MMNSAVSIFMSFIYAFMSFFNVAFSAPDLEKKALNSVEVTQENLELFSLIFETETEWLASLQLENGAIPMTRSQNGELRMNPYFANFASLALLDNAESFAAQAKDYICWYFSHLNTAQEDFNGLDGTIYDYTITVKNGAIEKEAITENGGKKSYDSTDSYAATFLCVVSKYYEKTGNSDFIFSNRRNIARVAGAMLATMHNGLTGAKPDHTVKYLMDNCEVYQGSKAAAELFEKAICPEDSSYNSLAQELSRAADGVKNAINEKMWNYVGEYYTPEMTKHGIPTKVFSWSRYYPCATAQLFPIISGVIDADTVRAQKLYGKFCESYEWERFNIPDSFYWGSNVYAATVMNDLDRVVTYMTEYKALLEKHEYPIYNADSAKVSMAAFMMLEKFGA